MRKYLTTIKILAACFIASICFYIGISMGQKDIKDDAVYSTNIAVINQDVGVVVDDESTNYANSVIETLGRNYTVVSPAIAQTGLENGTYGAIVTFPADFSANLVSINEQNPKQAVLALSINPKLPEEQYISLYTQLMNMQQQVNNNIAYAYVKTVYTQFHDAQDEIDTLLKNDDQDMDVLEKVALTNYAEMIDFGDIPNVEFEAESTDFTDFVNSSQSVAENMDLVIATYSDAQSYTKENNEKVQEHTKDITESSDEWINAMNKWGDDYSEGVKEYREKLLNWRESEEKRFAAIESYGKTLEKNNRYLDEYRVGLDGWINGILVELNSLKNSVENFDNIAGDLSIQVDDYNLKVPEYNALVEGYNGRVDEINKWLDYYEKYEAYINDDTNPEPLRPTGDVPRMENGDIQGINQFDKDTIEELKGQSTENLNNLKSKLEPIEEDKPKLSDDYEQLQSMEDFSNGLPAANEMGELSSAPTPNSSKLIGGLENLFSNLGLFSLEIDQKFSDETKEKAIDSANVYDEKVNDVTSAMVNANSSNTNMLNDLYTQNNEYVAVLSKNVYDTHEKEQGILSGNISSLKNTMENTSSSNHELMDSFVSRMPNSRTNSSVNKDVVEKTIEPIGYSHSYLRDVNSVNKKDYDKWAMWISIALFSAIIIDTVIVIVLLKTKNTMRSKNNKVNNFLIS